MRHAWWIGSVGLLLACGGQSESSPAAGGSGGAAGSGGAGAGGTGGAPSDAGADVVPSDAGPPPPGQSILFEVSYQNFAWQPTLKGVFITADGGVWSYDYFAGDAGTTPPTVVFPATEQELRARYGPSPTQTGSIPVGELFARFAEVKAAASGVLLRQHACDDAGERTSLGYLFDAATDRYDPVILGQDGDLAALNLAPQAAGLVAWLSQYVPSVASCKFEGKACTGATCPAPAPSCPKGQLPSVVGGCWSSCVNVDQCLSVGDCSQCGGGMACAVATDGSSHCLMSNCASADACTCPFTPPCAGGEAFCQSTGFLQVKCGG